MVESNKQTGGLSLRGAALIAGFGLLTMTLCAPFAFFHFLPSVMVGGDAAATVERFRTNGTGYVIGAFLLFITYVMDIIVAWGLYWLLRPGQAALSQLAAWMRLIYTALAFIGLMSTFAAYDLATNVELAETAGAAHIHAAVLAEISTASTITAIALLFFGVHLLILALAIWRVAHVPKWTAIAVALAGASYVIMHTAEYFAPGLDLGMLMILALGELLFMFWLLIAGWRLPKHA